MAEGRLTELRIYCLCGQKMKMSEEMFGLPGKCIACRQKIRIPLPEEMPEGATEIYLKDHPEFLRKVKPSPPRGPEERKEAPSEPKAKERAKKPGKPSSKPNGKKADAKSSRARRRKRPRVIALDVFDPLRNLCSLHVKARGQLDKLDGTSEDDSDERDALKGYLVRINRVRADMNDQLRQLEREVEIEVESTEEKIVQANLAARVGDVPFEEFQENIDRLRRRRYRLHRRRANIRGWLALRDPLLAGGYIELSFENIPIRGFSLTLPSEPEDSGSLVDLYTESLRSSLEMRTRAERQYIEAGKMERGDSSESEVLGKARAGARGRRRVATAAVGFWRQQIELLKTDYEGDVDTIEAQLEVIRDKRLDEVISRRQFESLAHLSRRSKADLVKAISVLGHALNANSPQDVPRPSGTLLGRLASREAPRLGLDSVLALVAAFAMCIAVLVPRSIGDFSLISAFVRFSEIEWLARWTLLGPLLFGLAIAATAFVGAQRVRGSLLAVIWIACSTLGVLFVHRADFGFDVVSIRMQIPPFWAVRPGFVMLMLANFGVFAAACTALWPLPRDRVWLMATALVGFAAAMGILTDGAGFFLPGPHVEVSPSSQMATSVTFSNTGLRTMYLVRDDAGVRGSYLYTLERKFDGENDSWQPLDSSVTGLLSGLAAGERLAIAPGGQKVFTGTLGSGTYRVQLIAAAGNAIVQQEQFEIGNPQAVAEVSTRASASLEESTPDKGESERQEPPVTRFLRKEVEVELKGIMASDQREVFTFRLYVSGEEPQNMRASLSESLYGPWYVAEYNPIDRMVTLMGGGRIVVLRTGERRSLSTN